MRRFLWKCASLDPGAGDIPATLSPPKPSFATPQIQPQNSGKDESDMTTPEEWPRNWVQDHMARYLETGPKTTTCGPGCPHSS